jgi:transcriptional regulator NrdR family protein
VKCPKCKSKATALETRHVQDYVRRRFICGHCEIRFTTHEKVVDTGEVATGRRTPEHMAEMRKQANRWGNKATETLLKRGAP